MTFLAARLARIRRAISQRRHRRFLGQYRAAVSDINVRLQDLATLETAAYVRDRMPLVQPVGSWRQVHDIAVSHATLDGGMVLEFGVFSGATVIVFDEYFNYDGWRQGEFRAFQEFVTEANLGYEYLTYNHRHQQVAVRII